MGAGFGHLMRSFISKLELVLKFARHIGAAGSQWQKYVDVDAKNHTNNVDETHKAPVP